MTALEYRADLYDVIHGRRTVDIGWYVDLCCETGGPVLELGAGTGRVVLPVARAGVEIDAMDIDPQMRGQLVARLALEAEAVRARVHILEGDMTSFTLPKSYRLIQIPFRSILHNTTEAARLACLRHCYDHLQPGGLLAFDVFQPSEEYMTAFEGDFEGLFRMDAPYLLENGFLLLSEWNSYDRQAQTVRAVHRYELLTTRGRISESLYQILDLAFLYPRDLEGLLREAGFDQIVLGSDFSNQPVHPGARDITVIARRPS